MEVLHQKEPGVERPDWERALKEETSSAADAGGLPLTIRCKSNPAALESTGVGSVPVLSIPSRTASVVSRLPSVRGDSIREPRGLLAAEAFALNDKESCSISVSSDMSVSLTGRDSPFGRARSKAN